MSKAKDPQPSRNGRRAERAAAKPVRPSTKKKPAAARRASGGQRRSTSSDEIQASEVSEAEPTTSAGSTSGVSSVTGLFDRLSQSRMLLYVLLIAIATIVGGGFKSLVSSLFDHPSETAKALDDYASGAKGIWAGQRDGFKALFPITPDRETSTDSIKGRTFDSVLYQTPDDDAGGYGVAVVDLGESAASMLSDPAGLFRSSIESAEAEVRGQLVRSQRLRTRGNEAEDFTITIDGGFVRGREILIGTRLFILIVSSTDAEPPGYARFVDSFREAR